MITKIAKRVLAVVLAVAMSVPLYVPAIAESFWDGQGSSASSGSQSAGANALFSMKGTVGENFIGYRLTAYRLTDGYDKDGENVSGEIIEGSHPIEVFFGADESPDAATYSPLTLEKNLTGTNRTYGSGTSLTPSYEFCATIGATGYEYSFNEDAPSLVGPVTNGREHNVDVWVDNNRTFILNYCGVRGDEENYLISVEPLFRASIAVEGTSGLVPQVRVGTVHDFAEYQKGFYGEGPVNTSNQTGASSRYYSFIAVNLGARYLKTLYCDDKSYIPEL